MLKNLLEGSSGQLTLGVAADGRNAKLIGFLDDTWEKRIIVEGFCLNYDENQAKSFD